VVLFGKVLLQNIGDIVFWKLNGKTGDIELWLSRVRADQMPDAVLERIGVVVLHARGSLEADD